MSEPLIERIAKRFLDRTLPCEEWTHEAHLRVGLWHVLRFGPQEALERLRNGIRAYNAVCGIANTATSGYHETTTRFYVAIIGHFLKLQDHARHIDGLAAELIATWGDKRLPLAYYSEARLMSAAARKKWLEPDLSPLPATAAKTPPDPEAPKASASLPASNGRSQVE